MRRFMQVSHIVFLILILAFALFELAIGAAAATAAPDERRLPFGAEGLVSPCSAEVSSRTRVGQNLCSPLPPVRPTLSFVASVYLRAPIPRQGSASSYGLLTQGLLRISSAAGDPFPSICLSPDTLAVIPLPLCSCF